MDFSLRIALLMVAMLGSFCRCYCDLCHMEQDRKLVSVANDADENVNFLGSTASIMTKSGTLRLQMQEDGNLVLVNMTTDGFQPIWATMTFPATEAAVAILQHDGNFIVYADKNATDPIWASQTSQRGMPPFCVSLSDHKRRFGITIYDSMCQLIWRSRIPSTGR
ncbi:hypothetical protein Ae201684P_021414 [Aphanomyces euteiches]|nr:hypothetical protein Ae201684P_021414 [Aphanomyces euteiches]KAH9146746.1 hypothetical protein AeRB84_009392 [Aphanomyces euteiches]